MYPLWRLGSMRQNTAWINLEESSPERNTRNWDSVNNKQTVQRSNNQGIDSNNMTWDLIMQFICTLKYQMTRNPQCSVILQQQMFSNLATAKSFILTREVETESTAKRTVNGHKLVTWEIQPTRQNYKVWQWGGASSTVECLVHRPVYMCWESEWTQNWHHSFQVRVAIGLCVDHISSRNEDKGGDYSNAAASLCCI